MSAVQIHLALNHFPIAGMFLALPILIWGLIAKSQQIKTVGIAVVITSALFGIIVAQTGDGAEETVEHKPLVTKHLIHEHEEAADAAMIAIQLSAVLGIAWLVMTKLQKNHVEKIFAVLLLTNLAAAGMIGNAAHKGGQIRHDEIRDGAPVVNAESGEKKEKGEADEKSESKEKEEKEENEKK